MMAQMGVGGGGGGVENGEWRSGQLTNFLLPYPTRRRLSMQDPDHDQFRPLHTDNTERSEPVNT